MKDVSRTVRCIAIQEWLGKYLQGVTAAVVLVSHEQDFLEKACNHIAEVNFTPCSTCAFIIRIVTLLFYVVLHYLVKLCPQVLPGSKM